MTDKNQFNATHVALWASFWVILGLIIIKAQ